MKTTAAARFANFVRLACAVTALVWTCLSAPAAASAAPAGDAGSLAFLEGALGKYPREIGLWDHALLHQRLSALLGKRFPFFRSNMWNTTVLSRQGHLIYVTGTRVPLGSDGAIFVADLKREAVWVWVMISGRLFEHREQPAQPELPAEVALFIDNWRARSRSASAPGLSYQ
ncbi:MAG: hypothetical protein A3I02_14660 [Betaproteobacteria bacterium RIFCSPLOWO2_02_FULL_67_26]|nr:MAG: hypothetical protein A3I02_14660 [Betaproteobacteria bacterium RIFCSPLOWO2_02_FULL_67_26]